MKPLPEERLLKLLRGKPKAAAPPPAAAGLPHPAAGSVASPPVRISVITARPKRSPVDIIVVIFIVVLVAEASAIVIQLVRPLPPVAIAVPAPIAADAGMDELPAAPSVSASASRPLFTPAAETGAAEATRRAPPSGAAKELAARLTLLGIIAGTPPQAIIEDSESKKSYFVAQGQQILEGAMLDAVFDTYVVLDLSGEKFELRL